MIPQSDKSRPIDSGKKPGHNDASVEREAAFTSSVAAFQPLLLKTRLVFRGLPVQGRLPSVPCPSGASVCYLRSLLDNQACEHRLIVLQDLPFGLSSAVLCFQDTELLGCSMSTSVLLSCSSVFSMIVESPVWSVQRALHKPRCGLALDWQVQSWILPTRRPPAACRVFLGLSVNIALVSVRGFVSFDLKPGYREALSDEKKSVSAAGRLNSGRASKTFKASRALGWVSTGTRGRCGRAGPCPPCYPSVY